MYREFNGTDHIVNSGYLELAEANNLIVVFPQANSSLPENAIGCWDTYGLTGELYGMICMAIIMLIACSGK
jgi:poly(3-hydroxybutyrate) depolymerase